MTLAATDTGNLFLALAAVAGLLILQSVVIARNPWEPLNRRFLFGLRVMMMLFAGRAMLILTDFTGFRVFVLLGAALIPLAVLLLTEGLLRRHAPPWAKTWVTIGVLLFGFLSFWPSEGVDPMRLVGLLLFQFSGFVIGGFLVLTRNRDSLSAAENKTVERLALSLVLLIPLAAADFLMDYMRLQVQMSPLGVLFLCWLAVSLGRVQAQHRAPLVSFVAIVLATGLSGFVVAQMVGMEKDHVILTLSVILAAVLVAVLFIEARNLRTEEETQTLLRHIADDRSRDTFGFMRGLQTHPLVEGAVIIDAAKLADFDRSVLKHIFRVRPVLRRVDPPFSDGVEGDHISHLFDLFDASHILLVKEADLTLVALSMPALARSSRMELELAAVQRMASLMAAGE